MPDLALQMPFLVSPWIALSEPQGADAVVAYWRDEEAPHRAEADQARAELRELRARPRPGFSEAIQAWIDGKDPPHRTEVTEL